MRSRVSIRPDRTPSLGTLSNTTEISKVIDVAKRGAKHAEVTIESDGEAVFDNSLSLVHQAAMSIGAKTGNGEVLVFDSEEDLETGIDMLNTVAGVVTIKKHDTGTDVVIRDLSDGTP